MPQSLLYLYSFSFTAAPIYTAENKKKIYACRKETMNSNTNITAVSMTTKESARRLLKRNPMLIIPRMIICPEVMLANNLNIKVKGFVKTPMISIGTIIGYKSTGILGANISLK